MTTSASGSIDTSGVDSFRQGVELTHTKHFTAGVAKIWSGWENHEQPQLIFGQSVAHDQETAFEDSLRYDSQDYLTLPKTDKIRIERIEGEMLRRLMDGSLDPFSVRSGSLDGGPVPSRGFKGAIMDGNLNEFLESDQIVTEYTAGLTGSAFAAPPFVDGVEVLARTTYMTGTVQLPHSAVTTAFSDTITNSPSSKVGLMMAMSMSSDHLAARFRLNPSASAERVGRGKLSMPSGFSFGNSSRGIDSVAFGGQTFTNVVRERDFRPSRVPDLVLWLSSGRRDMSPSGDWWNDSSGNNRCFLQTTASCYLTRTSTGPKNTLIFTLDGVNDELDLSEAPANILPAGEWTVYALIRIDSLPPAGTHPDGGSDNVDADAIYNDQIICDAVDGSWGLALRRTGPRIQAWYRAGEANSSVGVDVSLQTWYRVKWKFDGATTHSLKVGATAISDAESPPFSAFSAQTQLRIGTNASRSNFAGISVAEIFVYNRATTTDEDTLLDSYITEKFGEGLV